MAYQGMIKQYREPSLGERLAGFATQAGPGLAQALGSMAAEKQENAALKKMGFDVEGLGPDMKKLMVSKLLAQKPQEQQGSQQAISALDQMEDMIDKSGIGWLGSRLNYSDEARYNRGLFESLQASILPAFKSIFPRGMTQSEFQRIMDEWMPQPGDTEEKIRGKINGLKQMFATGQPISQQDTEMQMEPNLSPQNKVKFDITNPEHKARRDKVLKKTSGDRKKAQMILEQEFDL